MTRRCGACGKSLAGRSPRALYCDSSCRANAAKRRARGVPEAGATVTALPTPPPDADEPDQPADGPVTIATIAELEDADRASTALGLAAVALARRIDRNVDTGSALASAVNTLASTLAAATRGARRAETELDKIRRARDGKRGA